MDYDRSFKIIARESGTGLARLAGVIVDEWQPISDTLQTTERLADRAFLARRAEERFVLYMEAYTQWVESAPWSLLAKSGLLSERERLPTMGVMFVLLPRGYRSLSGTFRLSIQGETTQQLWFREVCLWQTQPEPWWEHHPGLMALTPLCQWSGDLRQVVTQSAESIRHRSLDLARRADLLTTLAVFGKLADAQLDIFSIIGREEMRENPLIQEFVQEGIQQGTVHEARAAVRLAIEARYSPEDAAKADSSLAKVTDLDRLHALLRRVVTAKRYSQVQRALREATR